MIKCYALKHISLTSAQQTQRILNDLTWRPMPGNQTIFITCPIQETLFAGTRGNGKTDGLIMDYAQDVGKGFGVDWRGILFRRTYPELADIVAKTKKWFTAIFPEAKFNGTKHTWTWPTGEQLLLRHIKHYDDYHHYHGHSYAWIGFEELTNWATSDCYEAMKSCNRSTNPKVKKRYRATCNSWGPGHAWVKEYFVDPAPALTVIVNSVGQERIRIQGDLSENIILMEADPDYLKIMEAIIDPNLRKAWLEGSWDIAAGGFFTDVWRPSRQVLKPFKIPDSWEKRRSFDWGSARPASLGFWAISDGSVVDGKHFPRGSIIRYKEIYFAKKNKLGQTVANKGLELNNLKLGQRIAKACEDEDFSGCVADPSMWIEDGGPSIYDQIRKGAEPYSLVFTRADNKRLPGWQTMRDYLASSASEKPESKGLWVFDTCRDFIRTIPILMRSERDPDDIDTDLEDHIADEVRYMCQSTIETTYEEDFLL